MNQSTLAGKLGSLDGCRSRGANLSASSDIVSALADANKPSTTVVAENALAMMPRYLLITVYIRVEIDVGLDVVHARAPAGPRTHDFGQARHNHQDFGSLTHHPAAFASITI
jgi:hypothetical protein